MNISYHKVELSKINDLHDYFVIGDHDFRLPQLLVVWPFTVRMLVYVGTCTYLGSRF